MKIFIPVSVFVFFSCLCISCGHNESASTKEAIPESIQDTISNHKFYAIPDSTMIRFVEHTRATAKHTDEDIKTKSIWSVALLSFVVAFISLLITFF